MSEIVFYIYIYTCTPFCAKIKRDFSATKKLYLSIVKRMVLVRQVQGQQSSKSDKMQCLHALLV